MIMKILSSDLVRQSCVIGGLLFCLTAPAHAQIAGATPASPDTAPAFSPQPQQPGPPPPGGGWNNERFERQEFREEMEKIRRDHEELEAARDKLIDQCVNATGQKAQECEAQKQALHEWHNRLHERIAALHEKMEAQRKEHPPGLGTGPMMGSNMGNGMMMEGGAWPHANGNPPPAGSPAGSLPPPQ